MSLSRRARIVEAVSNGQPARVVLQLVPPDAYQPVLRCAADAFASDQSLEGMRLFDVLRNLGASPLAPPSAPRRMGVSERASSLFHTERSPSSVSVAWALRRVSVQRLRVRFCSHLLRKLPIRCFAGRCVPAS